MEIKVNHSNLHDTDADVILMDIFEGADVSSGAVGVVDQALNGAISELVKNQDLRGKRNEIAVLYTHGALPAPVPRAVPPPPARVVGLRSPLQRGDLDVARSPRRRHRPLRRR